MSYLSQKANRKHQSTNSDIEHMTTNFKDSNEISFISFSDVPIQDYLDGTGENSHDDNTHILMADKVTVTISTYKHLNREITFTEIDDKKMKQRVANERRERQLNQSDRLFIAVAWIQTSI